MSWDGTVVPESTTVLMLAGFESSTWACACDPCVFLRGEGGLLYEKVGNVHPKI